LFLNFGCRKSEEQLSKRRAFCKMFTKRIDYIFTSEILTLYKIYYFYKYCFVRNEVLIE